MLGNVRHAYFHCDDQLDIFSIVLPVTGVYDGAEIFLHFDLRCNWVGLMYEYPGIPGMPITTLSVLPGDRYRLRLNGVWTIEDSNADPISINRIAGLTATQFEYFTPANGDQLQLYCAPFRATLKLLNPTTPLEIVMLQILLGPSTVDGSCIKIVTTKDIANLGYVDPGGFSLVGSPTSLPAGKEVTWMYLAADNTYYCINK
jgi:hypothetical protein